MYLQHVLKLSFLVYLIHTYNSLAFINNLLDNCFNRDTQSTDKSSFDVSVPVLARPM